jgi:hypothetical protein
VGRPEPAGGDDEVVRERLLERAPELARVVADEVDSRGLDAEPEQRLREEGAVRVAAVAANELRARDDDRGARPWFQSTDQPDGVIVITRGRLPPT